MSNTTTSYLSIAGNLANFQKLEAQKPAVKTATAYYKANISSVTSIDKLVRNYRLLSYALHAYGLGDQVHNTALIRKVLEQGTASPKALANTLPNPNWKAFAAAFDFSSGSPASASTVATTTGDYVEHQLETDQGASNPGVELALYFARVAPEVTTGYGLLADKNLLEVVQTVFNLPTTASAAQVDKEAKAVEKLVPLADLKDPKKLKSLVERFTASYDIKYGAGSDDSLTVYDGDAASPPSAASSILSGVISSNTTFLGSFLSILKLGG